MSDLDFASALQGDAGGTRVIARGRGRQAAEIVARARAHGIPVLENPQLAGYLGDLPPGEHLPPALGPLLATLLTFLLEVDGEECANNKRTGRDEP